MKIVQASIKDKKKLDTIAYRSKQFWGYPERYLDAWAHVLEVKESLLQEGRIYKAVDLHLHILGFYGLEGDPSTLLLSGFWIDPPSMGKGVGRRLFSHMMKTAKSLGAKKVEWESDPNAEAFYLKLGAKTTGSKTYELEGKDRTLPVMSIEL